MISTSLEPGQKVGRYTIRKLLAQGGMAEVYKADQELGGGIVRSVALKVIRPEYSSSPDFREMFLDEARCACRLSHPNIVQIFDVGEVGNLLYMAMELVVGHTVSVVNRGLREQGRRFSDEALYAIGIDCASALEAVHALRVDETAVNLVHRDVSPHNLLLSSQGALKLIDFGIAKAATNKNLTVPGTTKGKAGYFSPEQAMGKPLDGRSDLFSLGVTLYKLASGSTPFDQHDSHSERIGALVRGKWTRLEYVIPGLSKGLYQVIGKAMSLKASDRYPTAAAMRDALEHAAFEDKIRVGTKSLQGYLDEEGVVSTPRGTQLEDLAETAPGRFANLIDEAHQTESSQSQEAATSRTLTERKGFLRRNSSSTPPAPKISSGNPLRLPSISLGRIPLLVGAFLIAVVAGATLTLKLISRRAPISAVESAASSTPMESAPAGVSPPEPQARETPFAEAGTQDPLVELSPSAGLTSTTTHNASKNRSHTIEFSASSKAWLNIRASSSSPLTVHVDGQHWGAAPIEQKISAGQHTIAVSFPDGTTSPKWVGMILPDSTTTLVYDLEGKRWVSQ